MAEPAGTRHRRRLAEGLEDQRHADQHRVRLRRREAGHHGLGYPPSRRRGARSAPRRARSARARRNTRPSSPKARRAARRCAPVFYVVEDQGQRQGDGEDELGEPRPRLVVDDPEGLRAAKPTSTSPKIGSTVAERVEHAPVRISRGSVAASRAGPPARSIRPSIWSRWQGEGRRAPGRRARRERGTRIFKRCQTKRPLTFTS